VISAGLGFGGVPIRRGRVSEITLVTLSSAHSRPLMLAAS
jgi:predicted MPP superfamily phosphohydrolase